MMVVMVRITNIAKASTEVVVVEIAIAFVVFMLQMYVIF